MNGSPAVHRHPAFYGGTVMLKFIGIELASINEGDNMATNAPTEIMDWLNRARPLVHQTAHEIQPFGTVRA
jgi:hypothetical protein